MYGLRGGPALEDEAIRCEKTRFLGERRAGPAGGKEEIRDKRRYDQEAEKICRIDSRETPNAIANQVFSIPESRSVTPRQDKTGEHEKGADSQISATKNGLSERR